MELVSDAKRVASGLNSSLVGMSTIKRRRLEEIEVSCHLGTKVGQSTDFRDPKIKEGKQAEFLMFDIFPWTLVEKIGTVNNTMELRVQATLASAGHQPQIVVEPIWYF